MRSKLLLIIGLGVLGACLVAGSAVGQGGSVVGVGEGGVQINIPDGGDLDEVQVLPQCSNTADDDGDGVTDMADPDCTGPLDASESGSSGVPEPPTTTPEPPTDDGGSADGGGGGSDGTETTTPEPDGAVGPTGSDGRGTGELEESEVAKPDRNPNNDDDRQNGGTRAPLDPEADRNPDGSPTDTNPTADDRRLRPGPDRGPQLRHRPVHDPALPAADLPGLRDPVRDPLAGARLDQPDRDRLRHQPQRLHRRRPGLDAVHARDLGDVRRRRQRRRAQGPLQPRRRDLRRGPLPERRRRRR